MSKLTDERLTVIRGGGPGPVDRVVDDMFAMAAEIERHRAMVKRLEEWADACDRANHPVQSSRDVSAELRNRMRTP